MGCGGAMVPPEVVLVGAQLLRACVGAGGIAAVGSLPLPLMSTLSVPIRAELDFGEAGQGLLVSAFSVAAALATIPLTAVGDRWGLRVLLLFASVTAVGAAAGIAMGAWSYTTLLVLTAVAGIVNAGLQLAANMSLSASVPPDRQGLGFGVKQSAAPAAGLLAGLVVPAVGAWAGWRWNYVLLACLGVVLTIVGTRVRSNPTRGRGRAAGAVQRPPWLPLVLSGVAMTVANGAAQSLIAFLPHWAHDVGFSAAAVGLLVACGSATSIVGRVWSGARADRRGGRNLPVVMAQMLLGAMGLVVLATGTGWSVLAGGLLAFAVGWAWPGLLVFAVVRLGRDRPNSVAGVIQAGAFAGGAFGPLLFGIVAGRAGYPVAWIVMAVAMCSGAVLLAIARPLFIRDVRRRPLRVTESTSRRTPVELPSA